MNDDPFSSQSGPYSGGFPDDPVFSMPAAAPQPASVSPILDDDPFAAFSAAPAAVPAQRSTRTPPSAAGGDLLDGFGTAAPQQPSSGRAGATSSGPIDDDLLAGFVSSTGADAWRQCLTSLPVYVAERLVSTHAAARCERAFARRQWATETFDEQQLNAFIPPQSQSPPDSTPSASSAAERADDPPFSTSPQRPPVFSAEPDLSAFVVEDYDPPPRPAPARPAPRAPLPSVPHSASGGHARSTEGGRGPDSSDLTAAQQARKERIAAARAATFGDADEGHFDRQPDERSRQSSDNGRAYGGQGATIDRVFSGGQVRSHAIV